MQAAGSEKFWEVMSASRWTWAGLIVAIAVLAWIAVRVREWYREDDDPAEEADRMLSEIREIYQEGDLSEEEFRSIRSQLMQRTEGASADEDE